MAYLYLLPGLALFGAFVLYPLARAGWISLFEWDGVTRGTWVGADNYAALAQDADLRRAFLRSRCCWCSTRRCRSRSGWCWPGAASRTRARAGRGADDPVPAAGDRARRGRGHVAADLPAHRLAGRLRPRAAGRRPDRDVGRRTGCASCCSWPACRRSASLYDAARVDGAERCASSSRSPCRRSRARSRSRSRCARSRGAAQLRHRLPHDLGRTGRRDPVPALEVYERAFETGEVGLAAAIGVCLAAIIFALSFAINRTAERAART